MTRIVRERGEEWKSRAEQAEAELTRIRNLHHADCNTFLDDESDAVLSDFQECTCSRDNWAKRREAEAELAECREYVKKLEQTLMDDGEDREGWRRREHEALGKLDAAEAELAECRKMLEAARKDRRGWQRTVNVVERELAEAQAELERLRARIQALLAETKTAPGTINPFRVALLGLLEKPDA